MLQFSFYEKTCVLTEVCCVLLAFIYPDLVWCCWHIVKQMFPAFFLISKLLTLSNIILMTSAE